MGCSSEPISASRSARAEAPPATTSRGNERSRSCCRCRTGRPRWLRGTTGVNLPSFAIRPSQRPRSVGVFDRTREVLGPVRMDGASKRGRRHAHLLAKGGPEMGARPEARSLRDGVETERRRGDQRPGQHETPQQHVVVGRHPDGLAKLAREMEDAQIDLAGEIGERQRRRRPGRQVMMDQLLEEPDAACGKSALRPGRVVSFRSDDG